MNKTIVFLLVVISSLLTYVASGSNSSSASSKGDFDKYQRVVMLIEDGKELSWVGKDVFGESVYRVDFRRLDDGAEVILTAGTYVDRKQYEDTSEAFNRSKDLLDTYLRGLSTENEIFQVDVEAFQKGVFGILSPRRQETLHFRPKSQ